MVHNDAFRLVGPCPCSCRRGAAEPCWCDGSRPDPLGFSHNDRVRTVGACDCAGRTCAAPAHTDPRLHRHIDDWEQRRSDDRIRRGRPTASDLVRIARRPDRWPQYHRRTGG